MSNAEVQQLEKTILSTLKGVLTSEKVQIFLISHLLGAVVIIVCAKSGMSESAVSNLIFMLLGSSGLGSAVLINAHANVDAAATTAAIKSAQSAPVLDDLAAFTKQAITEIRDAQTAAPAAGKPVAVVATPKA